MFETLVNHNDDLKRLVSKGYAVGFDNGYLIVRNIPYLDQELKLQEGAIVAKLVPVEGHTVRQDDHQIFFAGSHPYNLDGTQIPSLGGGETTLALEEMNKDIVVQRSFSRKPKPEGAYADFFDKIDTYVTIISGPAISKYGANPLTFKARHEVPETVFLRHDILSSRAEIGDLSALLKNDVVAIIGLGGTGSYILDFLAKTPVREIRGLDPDVFHLHTVFRSPGMINMEMLGKLKSDIYEARYKELRTGIKTSPIRVGSDDTIDLEGVTFAFVCVDKGSSRQAAIDLLIAANIPFIDVGIGLGREHGPIGGLARTTYFPANQAAAVLEKGLVPLADTADEIYRTNIQISELNALNACLAVIYYKQLRGFYAARDESHQLVYEIADNTIAKYKLS